MEPWKSTCTPQRYARLQTREPFAACVTLGRALNQLRFASHAIDGISDDEHWSYASRQEFTAIFLAAATLYEAIDFARKHLGRHFRDAPAFSALVAIWRDKDTQELLERHIVPLRHHAVSHFDPAETTRLLSELRLTHECVFAIGRGNKGRDIHFRLSDALAVMTFTGPAETEAEVRDRLVRLAKQMSRVANEFIAASEQFLGVVMDAWGFEILPDNPPSDDAV